MDSYRLRVFHAVVKHQSYSRAAREALYISQPAVSKHIQALEAELGVELLQRIGKRIELTEAGRIVLRCAEQIDTVLDEMQRALSELQGLQRGMLRLGASSTPGIHLLPPVLATFSERYPGITLALDIVNSHQVITGVLERDWDLGVVGITPDQVQLQVQPYCQDALVLIVAPHHRLATQKHVSLADLIGETWVLREVGSASREVVEHALQSRRVWWRHSLTLQGSEAVKQAVIAGLGIAMVSHLAVPLEVQQGVLCVVPVSDFRIERSISVIRLKDARLPAAALAFLSLLHQTRPSHLG